MMNELAQQQRAFAAALVAPAAADNDPIVMKHGGHGQPLLRPSHPGVAPRFGLYQQAYRARLGQALGDNYPVLHQVVGDEVFDRLADGYLAAHPSRHPSIRWFGHRLADYLDSIQDALPHPSLADLARMEWALGCAFDGPDAPPATLDELLAIAPTNWPHLRFAPHPTLTVVSLAWAVEPLWRSLSSDPAATTDAPPAHPHLLLVWRRCLAPENHGDSIIHEQTHWRALAAEEAELLLACCGGETFASLCDTAARHAPDNAAALAAGYLRGWIESGLLLIAPTLEEA